MGLHSVLASGTRALALRSASRGARSRRHELTFVSLKSYVERNLTSAQLCAAAICAHSGWSRATVYRLFKAESGLMSYVQGRRLQRALRELAASSPRRRILDIALEYQFASEATFNRAFRRHFGLPPGAARSLLRLQPRQAVPCGAPMPSQGKVSAISSPETSFAPTATTMYW